MANDHSESKFDNSTPAARKVTLRPARIEDEAEGAFLREVYASSRADELAITDWNEAQREAFINMQFAAQQHYYLSSYPTAEHQIILLNGLPVGRIYVDRRPAEIRILDITILPEYRNLGIGAPLIENLLTEAAKNAKSVTIYVENYNPSQRLFARMGFSPIDVNGILVLMEWRPSTVSIDALRTGD